MKRIATVLISLLVIGFAAVSVVSPTTADSDALESRTADALRHLAGREVVGLERLPSIPASPGLASKARDIVEFEDKSTGDVITVDAVTGLVHAYSSSAATQRLYNQSDGTEMRGDAAVEEARAWVRRAGPRRDVDSMLVSTELRPFHINDDGSMLMERVVEFRGRLRGVPTFDRVRVTMNPVTLEVVSLHQDWHDGFDGMNTTPALSEEEAIARVAAEYSMPVRSSERAELAIERHPATWEPVLVWNVEISTGDEEFGASAFALVDACSGELLDGGLSG